MKRSTLQRKKPMSRGAGVRSRAKPTKIKIGIPKNVGARIDGGNGRLVDLDHLARVRSLPCLVCLRLGLAQVTPTQAHHLRQNMMGRRPGDDHAVNVCCLHHLDTYTTGLHRIGERKFWAALGIDPVGIAAALYAETLELRTSKRHA